MSDGQTSPSMPNEVTRTHHDFGKLVSHLAERASGSGQRHVSTLDLARYDKSEPSTELEKNVLRRIFAAFDVQQAGELPTESTKELCQHLGILPTGDDPGAPEAHVKSCTGTLLAKCPITFDAFWQWWINAESELSSLRRFQVVSANFSVPFHQQQLLIEEVGEKFSPSFRVFYSFKDMETNEVSRVSPWHDIPLYIRDIVRTTPEYKATNKYNFICEIPKWTRAKFEIATKEVFNPIKQDVKNGVPRFYRHGDMMWNYGAFPQTWESTSIEFLPNVKGDNDPIDAIEIGMVQLRVGQVCQVKILGVLGMIDSGEMDWKVICISTRDPVARFLKDIHDVPKFLPGCLDAIREWLRAYKICQGGIENTFALDGEFKDFAFARKIVHDSHLMWTKLKKVVGSVGSDLQL